MKRGFSILLFMLLLHALPARAIDFDINRISGDLTYNFDPVISETGLAAWMYYQTNDAVTAHSHIAVFFNNQRYDLTDEMATTMNASAKPSVQSNHLAFIANSMVFNSTDYNWELRESPVRDEGDVREIPALYKAYEEGGEQRLEPVFGDGQSGTNESIVAEAGMGTNAVRRHPSGISEIWTWSIDKQEVVRVTHDGRNDFGPAIWGGNVIWQKAKGWPFGWEMMMTRGGEMNQLTTNYYYDMGGKISGSRAVWYGWDGYDYEIFTLDFASGAISQLTSNRFDDVAPVLWEDTIVWEGYPAVEADIYMWRDGAITKISTSVDDDLYPRIWQDKIVWQGFDGDDYEIYLYDINKGGEPIKLTSNKHDDTNPEIHDNLVVWMGYQDNLDSEVFYLDVSSVNVADIKPVQLTNNDEDDREVKTGARQIIWVADIEGQPHIMLAKPK